MGWLEGYLYRKKVTISGETGAGTNYQVKLTIGATAGGDFHLENHCEDFPNDIRFTADDGTTELDYWVQEIPIGSVIVWVKVTDSLESDVDIYCYYGKSGVSSGSNISSTFIFGDDYSTNRLDEYTEYDRYGGIAWTVDSGVLKATISNTGQYEQSYLLVDESMGVTNWRVLLRAQASLGPSEANEMVGIKVMETAGEEYSANILRWHEFYDWHVISIQGSSTYTEHAGFDQSEYHLYEYLKHSTTWKYNVDGVNKVNKTEDWHPVYIGPFAYGYLSTVVYSFDYLAIGKYNDPEPAFSSAGDEETTYCKSPLTRCMEHWT